MYWRRRFVLLISVVAVLTLLVITFRAVFGSASPAAASGPAAGATRVPVRVTASVSHRAPAGAALRTASSLKSSPASATARSSAAASPTIASPSTAPSPCKLSQLTVAAQASSSSFTVGAQPVLSVKVTNAGNQPCVQDLADREIAFTVYNGESRVWGSHDCQVQPGAAPHTLMPDSPVLVSVTWSGLSSEPGCRGVRQRVGVGTYTLYVTVSGKVGKADQFAIR